MTAIDYYTLHIELINLYNSTFEFWLSISFAFIVAMHFSVEKMNSSLFYLTTGIYGVATAILYIRFIRFAMGSVQILEEIRKAGFEPPPYSGSYEGAAVTVGGILILMLVGSLSALFYAIRQHRAIKGT